MRGEKENQWQLLDNALYYQERGLTGIKKGGQQNIPIELCVLDNSIPHLLHAIELSSKRNARSGDSVVKFQVYGACVRHNSAQIHKALL